MTESVNPGAVQRKAVWGPKRTLVALVLIAFGLPNSAIAAGNNRSSQNDADEPQSRHFRPASKAKPGEPSANVKDYKLDDEITRRRDSNPLHTTRVIVTLVPGAELPQEFKRFGRGKLDIINGHVLDLPNGVIRRLEAHPAIFRVHEDRPIAQDNYRTSVTVGATTI